MLFKVIETLEGNGLYFTNGKRQQPLLNTKTFPVYEPGIGQIVAQCPVADEKYIDQVVQEAYIAQKKWSTLSPFERSKILLRAAEIIRENLEAISRWEVRTNGKPIKEALCDISSSADTLAFYGGILPATLKGDYFDLPTPNVDSTLNRFAYTRREPFGVVGCIGAWNYPFQTAVWKAAPALAAGNSVVYKPSPFAPGTPVILGEVLSAAGVPDGVFNIIQGEAETGNFLCLHNLIRKLSFTGSVATGRKIQEACSKRGIKPVTLELGGKSAFIVFEDADISNAVSAAIIANFLTQGSVCTNATRVFVQEDILNEFTTKLLKELTKITVGDPLCSKTNIGATINELHLNKVIGFVERAISQGATVLRGGKRIHPPGNENGFYLEPTLLTDVQDDWEIAREEIFGAVLLILPFKTEEEVVRRANNTEYGLASGLYTNNLARAHRVASNLYAGTIYINTYNDTEVHIPFGGCKNSGHGRENCVECLHSYTQIKSVYVNIDENRLEHNLN